MDSKHFTVNVAIEVNKEWASSLDREELKEYIKTRLDYAMGFRGQVSRIRLSIPDWDLDHTGSGVRGHDTSR